MLHKCNVKKKKNSTEEHRTVLRRCMRLFCIYTHARISETFVMYMLCGFEILSCLAV